MQHIIWVTMTCEVERLEDTEARVERKTNDNKCSKIVRKGGKVKAGIKYRCVETTQKFQVLDDEGRDELSVVS